MKLTLDAQVQLNSRRIENIMNDVNVIKDNHLKHMAEDIVRIETKVDKLLTILAEKNNA